MIVLLLFFCSGATALVYEVIWSKYLALLFGSTIQAQTVVLAAFMGGLALGNKLFGRRATIRAVLLDEQPGRGLRCGSGRLRPGAKPGPVSHDGADGHGQHNHRPRSSGNRSAAIAAASQSEQAWR